MEIIHHISWRPNDSHLAELLALGLDPSTRDGLLTLDIDESDSRWAAVSALSGEDAVDLVQTRATERERTAARWLVIHANGHRGYPQPDEGFGYLAASYDLTEYCATCGVGKHQQAPIRFRRDPGLRGGRVLQLNWIFDEFFTTPETWEEVFRPFGVPCREVVHHGSGRILASVVQLDPGEAPVTLVLADHASVFCERCERRKFLPYTRGFMPAFAGPGPEANMVRTRERFGSGASAHSESLISAELYRAVHAAKVRGCDFTPTKPSTDTSAPAG